MRSSAIGTSSANMRPNRDATRSKRCLAASKRVRSPRWNRTLPSPRSRARRRATASIGAEMSMPRTRPRGPTQRALASAGSPIPQARSATRRPGSRSSARKSTGSTPPRECWSTGSQRSHAEARRLQNLRARRRVSALSGSIAAASRPARAPCPGVRRTASAPHELLVPDPVRAVRLGSQPLAAAGLVVLVVALEPHRAAVALEGEHVRGDAVEEPAVVTDHHHAAGELEQRLLERPQRVHVEVVGRLVEQQHVGAAPEHAGEVDAVPLAARQILHALLLVGALEVERGHVGPGFAAALAELERVAAVRDRLPYVRLAGQRVTALVHVTEPHGLADAQGARVRLLLPNDDPEQGGLPGAVRADHADDPAGRELEREVVEQHVLAVGLAQAFGLDRELAEPRARRDVDLHRLREPLGLLSDHPLVGGKPRLALGLAGARGHAHPLELALEGALARARLLLLDRQALALLVEPRRVVAFPRDPGTAVELEDPARDVVQEVAVVSHRHDRARILLEEALEPRHRLGAALRPTGLRPPGRAAGSAARPWRSRACDRAPRRWPRRSGPGPWPAPRGASPSRRAPAARRSAR